MGASILLVLALSFSPSFQAGKPVSIDANRARELEVMLAREPGGGFPPASNRSFWSRPDVQTLVMPAIKRADSMLDKPLPEIPDSLYLEYFQDGNRSHYENTAGQLVHRLAPLVLAEAATGKGKYLPALEETIRALCYLKSWVLPAHDVSHRTFDGKDMFVDLSSSNLGAQLGYAVYLHKAALNPEVVKLAQQEIERRVIQPFVDAVEGKVARFWWMNGANNWNSVCLCGVTGATLSTEPSIKRRAEVIAASEVLIKNFLRGFKQDGYCGEGLGYWNYGYGNFLRLSETVEQATGGKVDFLNLPGAEVAGRYATRIEMTPGLSPAFSDCDLTTKPSPLYVSRMARKWAWAGSSASAEKPGISDLAEFLTFAFAPKPTSGPVGREGAMSDARTWFYAAGVYVGRPVGKSEMSVAFKGGVNNESHNHNDVGSYVVGIGKTAVVLDPGRENYTARTFSAHRYDSNLLNSFGHSVPVIDGKLESTGPSAKGVLVSHNFTDSVDTVSYDYRSCYAVPSLTKLVRTFRYDRSGTFEVIDEVGANEAILFETAIITLGEWRQIGDHKLSVTRDGKTLIAQIDTGGIPFTVSDTTIVEDAPVKPTRIRIKLDDRVREARVRIRFEIGKG